MIEAKDYPFWGVVFHPEKAPFEDLPTRVLEDEKVRACLINVFSISKLLLSDKMPCTYVEIAHTFFCLTCQ